MHEKGCAECESGLRSAIEEFSVFSVFRGLESSFFYATMFYFVLAIG